MFAQKLQLQGRQIPMIVGQSAHAERMRVWAQQIAPTNKPVLLLGPTGSGKDRLAKAIHQFSRQAGEFVLVNCMAIPESLFETEIFGRGRGAYTGAITDTKGRFGLAQHGSIFLNEIGELSPNIQAKFLEVLEEKSYRRVGEDREIETTARVIAATNIDVKEAIKQGRLRADLYYRLNVFTYTIPPLRDRREDIPDLVKYFLREEDSSKRMAPEALNALAQYDWPGNVRELQNVVANAATLSNGSQIIGSEYVKPHLSSPYSGPPPTVREFLPSRLSEIDFSRAGTGGSFPNLREAECEYFKKLLEKTKGNMTKAARIAGVNRSRLYNRIKRYKLENHVTMLRGN